MKYFTEKFMNKQRKMLLFSLAKAQANVGTKELPSWTDGKILKAEIQEDGIILFQVAFLDIVPMLADVCQIRLIDQDGDVAGISDKEIKTARGQGVYETIKINLFESGFEVI